ICLFMSLFYHAVTFSAHSFLCGVAITKYPCGGAASANSFAETNAANCVGLDIPLQRRIPLACYCASGGLLPAHVRKADMDTELLQYFGFFLGLPVDPFH
ncbi:hypothetical protein NE579_16625, partial [Intestinimonas massiliensis]